MLYNYLIGGMKMNLKNKFKIQMIILTLLSFLIFLYFFLQINVFIYTQIFQTFYAIIFICIILIQWSMYFSKNKKIPTINSWLANFLTNHSDIQHLQSLSYTTIYIQKRILTLLAYYFCLNIMIIIFSYYIFIRIILGYSLMSIFALFIFCLLVVLILYLYINIQIEKKYYQSYLNQDCQLYILMTYQILNVPIFQKAILNYTSLINISSALGRLNYPQEAYDFLIIWKQNAKKLPAIFKLFYYEHCIAHLAMLHDTEKFDVVYSKFQIFYQKHPRLHQREDVKNLVFLVSLYNAYLHQQYDVVLQLETQLPDSCHTPQVDIILNWAHKNRS